jgi:hypothetical protein
MSDDDPLKHKAFVTRENAPTEPAEGAKRSRAGRPAKGAPLGDAEDTTAEVEGVEEGGADLLVDDELDDDEEVRGGTGRGRGDGGAAADVADIW